MFLPSLPSEIWQRIFIFAALSPSPQHVWIQLWTTCRRMDKTFKRDIAKAYLDTFLKVPGRCAVSFDLGCGRLPNNVKKVSQCAFATEMFFDRIDEDSRRMVFKEGQYSQEMGKEEAGKEFAKIYKEKKYARWKSAIEGYLGSTEVDRARGGGFDRTPYVLSIYGASLDTKLPGLRFDIERREISFEWEGMFTCFCRGYVELIRMNMSIAGINGEYARKFDPTRPEGMAMIMAAAMVPGREDIRDVRRERF